MWTNEFWVWEDAPFPHNRAFADEVEAFGWKVDANGGHVHNATWPTDEETDLLFMARNKTRKHDDEDDEDNFNPDEDGFWEDEDADGLSPDDGDFVDDEDFEDLEDYNGAPDLRN
mmetsp:Transcript_20226/g.29248  ORF Transcript_20226/g.29248 Transcript_20226/m.29248 type:complete len:115 (-) Transcript_20226:2-346(-)